MCAGDICCGPLVTLPVVSNRRQAGESQMHRIFSMSLLAWLGIFGTIATAIADLDKVAGPLGSLGSGFSTFLRLQEAAVEHLDKSTGVRIWMGNVYFAAFLCSVALIAAGLRYTLQKQLVTPRFEFEEWVRSGVMQLFARRHFENISTDNPNAYDWQNNVPLMILFIVTWFGGFIAKPDNVQINQVMVRYALLVASMFAIGMIWSRLTRPFYVVSERDLAATEKKWLAKLRKSGITTHGISADAIKHYDGMPELLRNHYKNVFLIEFLSSAFTRCILIILGILALLAAGAYVNTFGPTTKPALDAIASGAQALRWLAGLFVLGALLPTMSMNIAAAIFGFLSGFSLRFATDYSGRYKAILRMVLAIAWLTFLLLPGVYPASGNETSRATLLEKISGWADAIFLAPLMFFLLHFGTYSAVGFISSRFGLTHAGSQAAADRQIPKTRSRRRQKK